MAAYVNKFGRKGGRGLRPLLLIPKVLGVGAYFGGVTAATALAFSTHPASIAEFHALADTISRIFLFAAVPGLVVAILCGIGLLIYHGRVFWRLRWFQVKFALVVVSVPVLHLWMSTHVRFLRTYDPAETTMPPEGALMWIRGGLVAAMTTGAMIIVLGRHKPRLGQRPIVKTQASEVAT